MCAYPSRHPAASTVWLNGSHEPAAASTTTKDPAKGPRRSVSFARPARVGATRKSSRIPGPRMATWWSATTAASMPIDTTPLPLFAVIEGSPFDHGGRRNHLCQQASSGSSDHLWLVVRESPRARSTLGCSPDTTPTTDRWTAKPTQPCDSYGAPGLRPAGHDKPHQFPQPGLLGRLTRSDDQVNEPEALRFHVTAGIPPEATLRDHPPVTRKAPQSTSLGC